LNTFAMEGILLHNQYEEGSARSEKAEIWKHNEVSIFEMKLFVLIIKKMTKMRETMMMILIVSCV